MIADFIDSWSLFASTYVTLVVLAALLGITGIPAVGRRQIFAGAAVSQAGMLGIGLALLPRFTAWGAGHAWISHPMMPTLAGSAFAALALMALEWRRDGRGTDEGLTAWLYLAGGSFTIVVLFHSPVGLQEVHERLASSAIGVSWTDATLAAILLLTAVGIVAVYRDRLALWITDPTMATVVGLPTRRYRLLYALWLGGVLGFAIHLAGVLVAFGFLVLPAMMGATLCRQLRQLPWAVPALGVGCVVVGILAAHGLDLPLGPCAVAAMVLGVAAVQPLRAKA